MTIYCDKSNTTVKHDESDENTVLQPDSNERSDHELVSSFVQRREEEAFREIVVRYGPLVMRVCKGVMRNEHDAEDSCQATFLVLAKNARKIRRRTSLASWLYGVAYRICLKASAQIQKDKRSQLMDPTMIEDQSLVTVSDCHATRMLYEEIDRLPEKYRAPLLLCCLEEKSREEAAKQLNCSEGAIKGRLERGRQLLRMRLLTRGIPVAVFVGLVANHTVAQPSISHLFVSATVDAAFAYSSGNAGGGGITDNVLSLAEGKLTMTSFVSTRHILAALLAVAILGLPCGILVSQHALARPQADDQTITQEASEQIPQEPMARFSLASEKQTVNQLKEEDGPQLQMQTPDQFVLDEFAKATAEFDLDRLSRLILKPDASPKGRMRAMMLKEANKDWVREKKARGGKKINVSFSKTSLVIRTEMKMGPVDTLNMEIEIVRNKDGWKIVSMESKQVPRSKSKK